MEMAAVSVFLFVLFAFYQPALLLPKEEEEAIREFLKLCPPFSCGNLGEISFPFTNKTEDAACGLFVVKDCDKMYQQIKLDRGSDKWYQLENINLQSYALGSISITDTELQSFLKHKNCSSFDTDLILPEVQHVQFEITAILTPLVKCNHTVNTTSCSFDSDYAKCPNFNVSYSDLDKQLPSSHCSIIRLPKSTSNDHSDIFERLTAAFTLQFAVLPQFSDICHPNEPEPWCLYPNGTSTPITPPSNHEEETKKGSAKKRKLAIGFGCGALGTILLVLVIFFCQRANRKKASSRFLTANSMFCWKNSRADENLDVFLKNYGLIRLKRYNYAGVKKMTRSFNDKLGQGGYGSVYKGKLPDGTLVAVKVLKESKRNGEEFMNEVASISKTSHVNIVTLLGFCCEGSKRALIYDFMSNGSLEKYIYEDNLLENNRKLDWKTLFDIAVGIARGLQYLHRGCNTRILHFDIKPHNILLDENFCPKISDFGLSKICPEKESLISMSDPRGTIGYIAPEVFCRNIGGVSHKSDVYSFGMLVLEMVGGRRNLCVTIDHTSQIYFPHWVYKRLELGDELGLYGIGNEEDNQIARKMVLVSLWCIQTNPSNRPAISKVVEMLQGSLELLAIPPKPYVSSPLMSPQN